MNWLLISSFIISFTGVPISLYLMVTGLMNYKRSQTKYMLYYISTFTLLAFGMFLYSLTPLLTEGQDFIAEITLGGSFILIMLTIPMYIEYLHGMYRKIAYISKLLYFSIGSGFTLLLFQPWEISYRNDFYGYGQILSDYIVICVYFQFVCVFIIMFQAFRVIKTQIDNEFVNIGQILEESTGNQEFVLRIENRKNNLRGKKKILNYIILSYFLGFILASIGILLPYLYLDSIGALFVVAPQAYFFSRDKEILIYLSAQRVREDTIRLKKEINTLHHQSKTLPAHVETEIQSMIDFIEKADLILPYRNK